jgi:glyceraldehyde-3-phosphate dehydrogenase/erythrose-4-phosphate dehydrogenase
MSFQVQTRVAVNGFGRVGKAIANQLCRSFSHNLRLVAINDINNKIIVPSALQQQKVAVFNEASPQRLPWRNLQVDTVIEATGSKRVAENAEQHLLAGAERVIATHPLQEAERSIIYGVNHRQLDLKDRIISALSCTANCAIPLISIVKSLYFQQAGFNELVISIVHTYDKDRPLLDLELSWLKPEQVLMARAGELTDTIAYPSSLAKSIAMVFPELKDKVFVQAVRIPHHLPGFSMYLEFVFRRGLFDQGFAEQLHQAKTHYLPRILQTVPFTIGIENMQKEEKEYSAVVDENTVSIEGNRLSFVAWQNNIEGYAARVVDLVMYLHELKSERS